MTESIELNEQERGDWLRLIRTEHVGPATFRQLLKRYGNAAKALQHLPELSSARKQFKLATPYSIAAELTAAEAIGASYIASCEPDYPEALRAISDPPPIICVCGDRALLHKPTIAIVGARNASAAGRKIAAQLATELGKADVVVTSGLARGIDGAAHLAALPTGTIAVVAGGLDVIYPPEHHELTHHIAEQGLIISELPPGVRPRGRDFPRRNRIISGLSLGVIVVEAAIRSGTLITARFALEQGREVFAVPGSPLDPRCQGTNRLIRNGAMLIENADDVLEIVHRATNTIRPQDGSLFAFEETSVEEISQPLDPKTLADQRAKLRSDLLDLLSHTPVHRDILLRECDAAPAMIADVLLEMVLAGDAEEQTGGQFSLSVSA